MKYLWCFLVVIAFSCSTKSPSIKYTTVPEPWSEGMGSQRAVIQVDESADAVDLDLLWRRHDPDPENRQFLIVNETTGDTIENIHRIYVDNEQCKIVFGPVEPGRHFFYYLPFKTDSKWGWYRYGYLDPEKLPNPEWVSNNGLTDITNSDRIPKVQCSEIQCRSTFDSFYPMEVIPTTVEKQEYIDQYPGDYLLFPEDREFPIRMKDEIPHKWIESVPGETFSGEACLNEYYVFQLGLFAARKNIQKVKIRFSDLRNGKHKIPSSAITCFNTGGVDPYGVEFRKIVNVGKDSVQALWIGIDIAESVNPGLYTGHVIVAPGNSEEKRIELKLKVNKTLLADRGDNELWRHSRLRWLNSTLGIDSQPVEPYTAIKQVDETSFDLFGRRIKLAESGLPGSIRSWDNEILSRPINIRIRTEDESMKIPLTGFSISEKEEGMIKWDWETVFKDIKTVGKASLDFDGTINYKLTLKAEEELNISDIWLEIPFRSSIGQYIKGMGFRGDKVPMNHTAKWEGPHDSFWIGNTSGGLHCELRGSDYHGPMLNLFPINYPDSWYNGGNGYFSLVKSKNEVVGSVHSGSRILNAGENITFEFSLLITPVKERNTKEHFNNLYYHNARDPWPTDAALDAGVRIINVHHGNKFNPYINYPFIATEEMKGFVDHWHEKGLKVKIYYTVREITNHVTEIWALRSLGDEILRGSEGSNLPWLHGGGYPWLIEHFVSDYTRAWYHPFQDGFVDAAILTAPGDTRLYNYYVEGLRWLTENIGIDGLYLDDVTYDRRILKRMRKVMEAENPGCIIDLHSHDDFFGGPVNQYAEFFPYVDKLWFGEGFEYDEMSPENWLVEVSGIPFGLMGDMLQGGGNRWLGMLFGMSVRLPWTSEETKADPRPVWGVWDEFGIADSEMIGFWEDCPVKTTHPDVMATVYRKDEQALIAIGSWAKNSEKIKLVIDWEEIGINKEQAVLVAPEVKDFQPNMSFDLDAAISVEPSKGWLIYLSESKK